jgi:hypothetical protein
MRKIIFPKISTHQDLGMITCSNKSFPSMIFSLSALLHSVNTSGASVVEAV